MSEPSRRLHERFDHRLPVAVHFDGREVAGYSRNISVGGMFLEVRGAVPFGAHVHLKFRLQNLPDEVDIPAVVRWSGSDGIGVQFSTLRAREVWALNQLLVSLRGSETLSDKAK